MENIEDHHEHFIVIVLRAVDDSGNATSHNHSIVIDVRQQHGKFDVVTLMAALQGTDIESLNENFISSSRGMRELLGLGFRPRRETLPNQGTAERALGSEASQLAQRGRQKGKQQPLA